jgi:predicted  nucleic acid-binding Zn-ribbon protein
MPHKCAHCGRIIEGGSPQLLTGCDCGSKVFLYLRQDYKDSREKTVEFLDKQKIDKKHLEWLNEEFEEKLKEGETVSLDIENILQLGRGRFILDLHSLLKGEPIVVKEKGVYYIDLEYAMRKKH